MPATVDSSARDLIAQHGTGAVYAAVERLNQSIDEGHRIGRDFWAQVVHAIHEYQRDVQSLAGHASLADTQRYIEQSPETKRRVVAMSGFAITQA
jgi:hypothetical protein